MSKRKPKQETAPESTPSERVHKAGGQAEVIGDELWERIYTPQWREQVQLELAHGTFESVANKTAYDIRDIVGAMPAFDWKEVSSGVWVATGSDGFLQTKLPIVTITRVAS